jgi:hypothetical protein
MSRSSQQALEFAKTCLVEDEVVDEEDEEVVCVGAAMLPRIDFEWCRVLNVSKYSWIMSDWMDEGLLAEEGPDLRNDLSWRRQMISTTMFMAKMTRPMPEIIPARTAFK